MRKFAKPILVVAGVVLIAYALAVLGLNIYLQSEAVQSRICASASKAIGRPLTIRGSHYTPWSGFTVSGVVVPRPEMEAPPFFAAASLSLRFSFLELLRGKLAVKDVALKSPVLISIGQPIKKPEPPAAAPTTATPVVPAPTEEIPRGGAEIVPPEPTAEPAAPAGAISIHRARATDGRLIYCDEKGRPLVSIDGIDITAHIKAGNSATGTASAEKLSVAGLACPRRLKADFSYEGGQLAAPDIRGDWAGGKLFGKFAFDARAGYAVDITAEDIRLKNLAKDAGFSGNGAKGSLFGHASLHGRPGDPDSLSGNVEMRLQKARFQPVDFVRQIGDLTGIQELQMLQLKAAEAQLAIRERRVIVDKLLLESENLFIDGSGNVNFEGKMKLHGRLHMNDTLRRGLRGLLANNFEASVREGYQFVAFSVTGNTSRPKTDLLDKLTGIRIGQEVSGFLKNLFTVPSANSPAPSTTPVPQADQPQEAN